MIGGRGLVKSLNIRFLLRLSLQQFSDGPKIDGKDRHRFDSVVEMVTDFVNAQLHKRAGNA